MRLTIVAVMMATGACASEQAPSPGVVSTDALFKIDCRQGISDCEAAAQAVCGSIVAELGDFRPIAKPDETENTHEYSCVRPEKGKA